MKPKIIIRCCGERTEKKCIELAKQQGNVHIIKAYPFGESLRQSYKLGITFTDQKWIPMIDGDVLLLPGTIERAINYLEKQSRKIYCLDGKTKDKIFMKVRRAGIHIYKRNLLKTGLQYINDRNIKPESHVRREMERRGYATITGDIVFGYHDYEQYYCDLWRKAFCQSQKLAKMIKRSNIKKHWQAKAKNDPDFQVIIAAHKEASKYRKEIIIDKRLQYGAKLGIKNLGLTEKGGI